MTDTPPIEKWAKEEYLNGVSPEAALRELCRTLGANGNYPILHTLIEDQLSDANRKSREIMKLKNRLGEPV